MLAPISGGRRDKRSSFRILKEYLTREADPVTGERLLRGDVVLSDNLLSLETAHAEMRAVAMQNKRVTDPVYHYQLTWHPGEQPSREQWEEAAKKTLADLGFEKYQYILAAHEDKKHFHVHIMLNRVHPETYRAHTPKFDKRTLDKALREIEHEQGWQEDPGLCRWDEIAQEAVRNTPEEMERHRQQNAADKARGKAAEVEHYNDIESLQVYARKEPTKAMQKLLARDVTSWQEVHVELGKYGLQIERAEHGGYTVKAIGTELRVKASDVFRSAFAGKQNRAATERKLGPWQEPERDMVEKITGVRQTYTARTRRDPEKRAQQREEREAQRKALRAEFRAYRAEVRAAQREHTEAVRRERQETRNLLKQIKREIRSKPFSSPAKRALLSHAVARCVVQQQALKARAIEERLKLKPKTYQQWVTERALASDRRAVAQLRGWRYQDQRNLRRGQEKMSQGYHPAMNLAPATDIPDESSWSQLANEHVKQLLERNQQLAQALAGIEWAMLDRRTGDVAYLISGRTVLVDRGRCISVLDSSEAAIVLGLEMAIKKYGTAIRAIGPDTWCEQIARVAARNGINVQFASEQMQHWVKREREAQQQQSAGREAQPERTRGADRDDKEIAESLEISAPPQVRMPETQKKQQPPSGDIWDRLVRELSQFDPERAEQQIEMIKAQAAKEPTTARELFEQNVYRLGYGLAKRDEPNTQQLQQQLKTCLDQKEQIEAKHRQARQQKSSLLLSLHDKGWKRDKTLDAVEKQLGIAVKNHQAAQEALRKREDSWKQQRQPLEQEAHSHNEFIKQMREQLPYVTQHREKLLQVATSRYCERQLQRAKALAKQRALDRGEDLGR